MTCTAPNCTRPVRYTKTQLCCACYQRLRKTGSLELVKPRRPVADTLEDLRALDDAHAGANEAAERTGFPTAHALERWLYRNGQSALWLRLKARDPIGEHSSRNRGWAC